MEPARPDDLAAGPDADKLLQRFEETWRSGVPPRLEAFLPPRPGPGPTGDDAGRLALLQELIRMDLEYRWRRRLPANGSPWVVEDYARRYPELAGAGPLWLHLIGEEYRARRRWGDRPSSAEYAARFPRQGPKLPEMLLRIDAELAAEFGGGRKPMSDADAFQIGRNPREPAGPKMESAAELLDALRQNQLLSPTQLNAIVPGGRKRPSGDAKALAGELMKRGWLTAYQANQLLQGRGEELVLGPYLLLERLGEGGAGQVFKARHQKMDRIVALKIIRKELLSDAEAVGRFYREIQVVSQLDHPNVVRAYDAGPMGAGHFLAMEYAEGSDLGRGLATRARARFGPSRHQAA